MRPARRGGAGRSAVSAVARLGVILGLVFAAFAPTLVFAADLGVHGKLFPIVEVDLLDILKAKLEAAKTSGKIDALNKAFAKRSMATVERPPKVAGLVKTKEPRSWLYDPTYTVPKDLADQQGRVFARAGQQVNPLLYMPNFDRVMVFIDGDDERQVGFGLTQLHKYGPSRTRLILVNGSPIELMKREKTAVYFDQMGLLTDKFRLQQVPAVIVREGDKLRISEVKP